MAYTPQTRPTTATWLGAPRYVASTSTIAASWRVGASYIGVPSISVAQFGATFVTKQQRVAPAGITGVFGTLLATRKGEYIPPTTTFTATWKGAIGYTANSGVVAGQWRDVFSSEQTVLGAGFDSLEFGLPVLYQPQIAYPAGIEPPAMSPPVLYRDNEYVPPYAVLNGSWFNALAYAAPSAIVNGQWKKLDAPKGLVQTFGTEFLEFGLAGVKTAEQIKPAPIAPGSFGTAGVKLWLSYVRPSSIAPDTWNASNSGRVSNSQRFVSVAGFSSHAVPGPSVINTTATQVAAPTGIAAGSFGALLVNPRTIAGVGFNAFASGTAAVRNWNMELTGVGGIAPPALSTSHTFALNTRYVRPTGLAAGALGTGASITNLRQTVVPTGLAPLGFGTTALQLKLRFVELQGLGVAPGNFGNPETYIVVPRFVKPSGIAPLGYGTANVESTIRYVAPTTIPAGTVGALTTWYRVRTVAPVGMIGFVGAPGVKDGKQYVAPVGLNAFASGTPSAFRNEAFVKASGFAGDMGSVSVQLARRTVLALRTEMSEAYGRALVYNSKQIVAPIWFFDNTPAFPAPLEVFNANRVVTVFGIQEPRFSGGAEVLNTARVVTVPGTDSLEFGGALAADRIRTVQPEGFTETFVSHYGAVLNTRYFVEPSGIVAGRVGVPTIPDRRQPMDAVGAIRPGAFGEPLVAAYLRKIDLAFRGISTPMSAPTVHLYTRYVAPAGVAPSMGRPSVEERFNVVIAGGYDLSLYGTATIYNLTPEVFTSGISNTVVGRPSVRNNTTIVRPAGIAAPALGVGIAGRRVRSVFPNGVDTLRMSSLNRVADDAPQPPTRQIIDLSTDPDDPANSADPAQYGVVRVRSMSVAPEGFFREAFGKPSMRTNVITVRSIIPGLFGTASLNRQQEVRVPSIELKLPDKTNPAVFGSEWFGRARISPTAVTVPSLLTPAFPAPSLTNKDRGVTVSGMNSLDMGAVGVISLRRFVAAAGIRAGDFGMASVPGEQTVRPFWGVYAPEGFPPPVGYDAAKYGSVTVKLAPATNPGTPGDPTPRQTIKPLGLVGAFGTANVQNFHRTIFVATINPGLIPTPVVARPRSAAPAGLNSLEFGTINTGHKIRWVYVAGDIETQWGPAFDDPIGFAVMTVRVKHPPVKVKGFTHAVVATPAVSLAQRGVGAQGFDAGTTPAPVVTTRAGVSVQGFDSLVMGVPKRPVHGQIELDGQDEAAFGLAAIGRGVHAAYIEPGLVGAPRVRTGIRVLGLEGEFGSTVVVGESNCGSKLAVVAQMGDLTKFGQHGVHQ